MGKWHIEHPINARRFTDAYAARDAHGQGVVLKVLRKGATRESALRRQFMREYLVAEAIDHPGVVRMLARDVLPDGSPVLVMERLDGETLEERRRARHGGRLPANEAVELVLDILDVLAATHAKNITHGNIRPTKVMLTNDGVVKVLELGAMSESMSPYERARFHFMAPEQTTQATPIDARTDIFGVGATLFTLLSGQYPYGPLSVIDYLSICGLERPQSLGRIAPDLSPALVAVVDRALELEPAKRFASVASMASALRSAIDACARAPKTHEKYSSTTIALATVPRLPTSRVTTIPPPPVGSSPGPRAPQQSGVSWHASWPLPSRSPSLPFASHPSPLCARCSSSSEAVSHSPAATTTAVEAAAAALRARATTVPTMSRRLDKQRLIAIFLGFAVAMLIGTTVRVVQALMEEPVQVHAMAHR